MNITKEQALEAIDKATRREEPVAAALTYAREVIASLGRRLGRAEAILDGLEGDSVFNQAPAWVQSYVQQWKEAKFNEKEQANRSEPDSGT